MEFNIRLGENNELTTILIKMEWFINNSRWTFSTQLMLIDLSFSDIITQIINFLVQISTCNSQAQQI